MVGLRPLILVRGFGGADVSDERASGYQGFNDGTVYPDRRGENYIYEGFVLRALKSDLYQYHDATNVVGFYPLHVPPQLTAPPSVDERHHFLWNETLTGGTIALDPRVAAHVLAESVASTIWIYRYYDLAPRDLKTYGQGLVRLVDIISRIAHSRRETFDGVDIVAHSMGGLVVRAALDHWPDAEQQLHRVVTLGTPHRGIAFQHLPSALIAKLPFVQEAHDELDAFSPDKTTFRDLPDWFIKRTLTVVGTEYRTYGNRLASIANRIASLQDEGTLEHSRSDGLVQQSSAQLPGASRTFVHKCHGGTDSLVTSREAYEIAMRYFHGTHRVRIWLDEAQVSRGGDAFGRSEFYLGLSIKPRFVDFELFHQGPEANNCYGPFSNSEFDDELPNLDEALQDSLAAAGDRTNGWAGPDRLVWEGWIDYRAKPPTPGDGDSVFRLDFYVGERDSYGIGFSDNVVFRKQYYLQARFDPGLTTVELLVHTGEQWIGTNRTAAPTDIPDSTGDLPAATTISRAVPTGEPNQWTFWTIGTGFNARWRLALDPAGEPH